MTWAQIIYILIELERTLTPFPSRVMSGEVVLQSAMDCIYDGHMKP